mgnify:FL=1
MPPFKTIHKTDSPGDAAERELLKPKMHRIKSYNSTATDPYSAELPPIPNIVGQEQIGNNNIALTDSMPNNGGPDFFQLSPEVGENAVEVRRWAKTCRGAAFVCVLAGGAVTGTISFRNRKYLFSHVGHMSSVEKRIGSVGIGMLILGFLSIMALVQAVKHNSSLRSDEARSSHSP